MKAYFDDLLVWVIILAILIPVLIALFKRKQAFIFIVGTLILLGAVPAGGMLEVSVNFQETRIWGLGYFVMAIMAIVGILIMVYSKKLAKK